MEVVFSRGAFEQPRNPQSVENPLAAKPEGLNCFHGTNKVSWTSLSSVLAITCAFGDQGKSQRGGLPDQVKSKSAFMPGIKV